MEIKLLTTEERFREIWHWDWEPGERLRILYAAKRWTPKPLLREYVLELFEPDFLCSLNEYWLNRLPTMIDLCGKKWEERQRLLGLIEWARANYKEPEPPPPPPPPSEREVKLMELLEEVIMDAAYYKRDDYRERFKAIRNGA